jgi:hypothetical protein
VFHVLREMTRVGCDLFCDVHVSPRPPFRCNVARNQAYRLWGANHQLPTKLHLLTHRPSQGDEGLPYNFIAGAEGIPKWGPRLQGLQNSFTEAFMRHSPDFQVKRPSDSRPWARMRERLREEGVNSGAAGGRTTYAFRQIDFANPAVIDPERKVWSIAPSQFCRRFHQERLLLGSTPRGDARVSGRAHTPSWVYRRRAHGPTLEYYQLPSRSSTHSQSS